MQHDTPRWRDAAAGDAGTALACGVCVERARLDPVAFGRCPVCLTLPGYHVVEGRPISAVHCWKIPSLGTGSCRRRAREPAVRAAHDQGTRASWPPARHRTTLRTLCDATVAPRSPTPAPLQSLPHARAPLLRRCPPFHLSSCCLARLARRPHCLGALPHA